MADPAPTPARELGTAIRAVSRKLLVFTVGGVILLLLLAAWLTSWAPPGSRLPSLRSVLKSEVRPAEDVGGTPRTLPPDADADPRSGQSLARMRHAAAKAEQRRVVAGGEYARSQLGETREEHVKLKQFLATVMETESGKFVTWSPNRVAEFAAAYRQDPPDPAAVDRFARTLDVLLAPIAAAYADDADVALPPPETLTTLGRVRALIGDERERVRLYHLRLAGVFREAMLAGRSGTLTVKAAIDAHEHAEAAAEAKKIEEGRRLGRARAVEEAARREEDAVRLKLAASSSDPAAARWAELRAKARSPAAQKFLQPFLEPGFGQPRTDLSGKLHFDLGAEKKPMSLAALKAAGVFTPGDKGLVAFATLGAHPENDRPRWKVDANADGWSKETRESVTHSRGLLVELADALVDEKLLRP